MNELTIALSEYNVLKDSQKSTEDKLNLLKDTSKMLVNTITEIKKSHREEIDRVRDENTVIVKETGSPNPFVYGTPAPKYTITNKEAIKDIVNEEYFNQLKIAKKELATITLDSLDKETNSIRKNRELNRQLSEKDDDVDIYRNTQRDAFFRRTKELENEHENYMQDHNENIEKLQKELKDKDENTLEKKRQKEIENFKVLIAKLERENAKIGQFNIITKILNKLFNWKARKAVLKEIEDAKEEAYKAKHGHYNPFRW